MNTIESIQRPGEIQKAAPWEKVIKRDRKVKTFADVLWEKLDPDCKEELRKGGKSKRP